MLGPLLLHYAMKVQMIRAYTMRYLADIKGLPYYQRRYPKALDGQALTSKMFKCRIHASLDDASAVAMEIQRISNAFDDYVHTLTASNSAMLNDLEIQRMVQSYLEVNRLKVGELATSHSAYNNLRADLDVFDSPVNIRAVVAGATEAHTIAGFCDTQAMLSFQVIHRFFTLDWR